MAKNPSPSQLDSVQIFQRAFQESDDSLRVDANITANISGAQEVIISQEDDSVAIGDGTTLFTGTTVTSKHGIDVNIIGGNTVVTGDVTTSVNGLSNFQTSQYIVGTSVVQLTPSPLSGRSSLSIRITATSGDAVFIGNNNNTTIFNGYPLYNGDTLQMDIDDSHEIWAITSSSNQTVYILEIS